MFEKWVLIFTGYLYIEQRVRDLTPQFPFAVSLTESKFSRMVSIEDSRSPRASRRRMISYKADDRDSAALHSAGSVLSLDSEIDDVKKPSEMVSLTLYI